MTGLFSVLHRNAASVHPCFVCRKMLLFRSHKHQHLTIGFAPGKACLHVWRVWDESVRFLTCWKEFGDYTAQSFHVPGEGSATQETEMSHPNSPWEKRASPSGSPPAPPVGALTDPLTKKGNLSSDAPTSFNKPS